jgi:hypothetical protein
LASTLETRDGLAPLKSQIALSGGFTSIASVVSGARARLAAEISLGDPRALERLPHRGDTPVLWHVATDARGPTSIATARIPKAVVEDLVALAAGQVPRPGHP